VMPPPPCYLLSVPASFISAYIFSSRRAPASLAVILYLSASLSAAATLFNSSSYAASPAIASLSAVSVLPLLNICAICSPSLLISYPSPTLLRLIIAISLHSSYYCRIAARAACAARISIIVRRRSGVKKRTALSSRHRLALIACHLRSYHIWSAISPAASSAAPLLSSYLFSAIYRL